MRGTLAVLVFVCSWAGSAAADNFNALRASLGTLSAQERALIAPHLSNGPVMLTEFGHSGTDLPAVIYVARVHATPEAVAAVVGDPSKYPDFMKTLKSVNIVESKGRMTAFQWTWAIALLNLSGTNVITSYRSNPSRYYRFDIRATGGELGIGRIMWRIYPEASGTSVVVFSSRLDMRDANYITRQLSSGGNAVNRTINVTIAMVTLLEVKAEAERRAGHKEAKSGDMSRPFRRPKVNMDALFPLLRRGDLVFMDIDGDVLNSVAVVGSASSSDDTVRQVMTKPEVFGKSLAYGTCATVEKRTTEGIRFTWRIPIPLLSIGGTMILRTTPSVIAVDGISGTLSKGRWRFDTHQYQKYETGVIAWARFDPADSPRLVRALVAENNYFSHGFVAATQLAVMRSLRKRVYSLGP